MDATKLLRLLRVSAKVVSTLMAAFIIFMFVGETFGPDNDPGKKQGILGPVRAGQTLAIPMQVKFGKWQSNNPAVATVDANGVVTGLSAGHVVLTYTTSKAAYNYNIAVAPTLLHDGILLGLMALLTLGMLLVWRWELAGAWLTLAALTGLIAGISLLNQIPLSRDIGFAAAGIPAIVLLLCHRMKNPGLGGHLQHQLGMKG